MSMNNRILLLRYSDFHGVHTIAEHQKVINQRGHCWWAKIGKQPSEKYLDEFLSQDERTVFLYTADHLHKCSLGTVIRERPANDYPDYYKRDIFGSEEEPTVYFELCSIEEIDLSCLDNYLICSSGKEVLYDLKKTISSYMFIQDRNIPLPPKPAPRSTKPKKVVLDQSSCVYKKDGVCTNRSCVNYSYECLRPRYCLKQRPIKETVK